uniref:Uncharacterized protein n=1 Tax=Oryza punctata TaxID=4537 RepID=A0A0E0L2Y4_ORYPU
MQGVGKNSLRHALRRVRTCHFMRKGVGLAKRLDVSYNVITLGDKGMTVQHILSTLSSRV